MYGTSPTLSGCQGGRAPPGRVGSASTARSLGPGTKLLEMKEWYQNREDMLELKHTNKVTGLIVDYFKPGHPQALRGE